MIDTCINFDDTLRYPIKIFVEKIIITAANHHAEKLGLSRSKYIRYSLIEKLIRSDYPFQQFTEKFDDFYKFLNYKEQNRGMTVLK
jgi:hypothetical protein